METPPGPKVLMLTDFVRRIEGPLKARFDYAKNDFKTVEIVFKFASWLTTIIAVTLAARVTNSRILWALSFFLSLIWTFPIAALFHHRDMVYSRYIPGKITVYLQIALIAVLGGVINWRIRVYVNLFIDGQYFHLQAPRQ